MSKSNEKQGGKSKYPTSEGFAHNKKDDVQIWYRITGEEGLPVVTLIPGTEGSSIYWSEQIVSALQQCGYRVLIFDPRDTGKSTWVKWPKWFNASKWQPGQPTPYPFISHYEDLLCLWELLGIAQSHIIGVSQGGMIGQIAAIRDPKSVLSLCLLSTSPTNQFDDDLDPLSEQFYAPVPKMAMKTGMQAAMKLIFGKKYIESAADMFVYLLDAKPDERADIVDYFKQIDSWGGYNIKSSQGMAYVNQDSRVGELNKINAPTLILHGSRDSFFSLKHVQTLRDGIAGAKLIIIKDALHAIPVSMYHQYMPDILKTIKRAK